MQIVLGLALTGYLLPWDQKGYWATRVATKMMGLVPVFGQSLQRIIVGGSEYGHHTLTRFFALHAGVLPALLTIFLTLHVLMFRRHGLTVREPKRPPDSSFWPEQVLRDAVACLAVAIVVLVLVCGIIREWKRAFRSPTNWAPNSEHLPTQPKATEPPARSLLLVSVPNAKYLEEFPPIVGAIVVPGLVMLTLFLMPIVGRWQLGHRFKIVWTFALLVGAASLPRWRGTTTTTAARRSRSIIWLPSRTRKSKPSAPWSSRTHRPASRPQELALLQSDPKTQGPKLFRQHCEAAPPHPRERSADDSQNIPPRNPALEPLGIRHREWFRGILDPKQIAGPHYSATRHSKQATWSPGSRTTSPSELASRRGPSWQSSDLIDDVTLALAPKRPACWQSRRSDQHTRGPRDNRQGIRLHRMPQVSRRRRTWKRPRSDRLRLAQLAHGVSQQPGRQTFLRRQERPHARVRVTPQRSDRKPPQPARAGPPRLLAPRRMV